MAIDSSVFAADIPAGTYAAGDIVPLVNIDGPANVRSGRGAAILKNIFVGSVGTTAPIWKIHVKNSDWVDDVQSVAAHVVQTTAFDQEAGCSQGGHDATLTENSGWQVYAECIAGATSTVGNSIFALIDVDYPQVSSITDPRKVKGLPASIQYNVTGATVTANGAMVGSTWQVASVDYFKAGNEYALDAVETYTSVANLFGFIAFSNAAGMGGLQRIIPINSLIQGIRYPVEYASKLVKGPMDIKLKFFGTAGTTNVFMMHDYVKRVKA